MTSTKLLFLSILSFGIFITTAHGAPLLGSVRMSEAQRFTLDLSEAPKDQGFSCSVQRKDMIVDDHGSNEYYLRMASDKTAGSVNLSCRAAPAAFLHCTWNVEIKFKPVANQTSSGYDVTLDGPSEYTLEPQTPGPDCKSITLNISGDPTSTQGYTAKIK